MLKWFIGILLMFNIAMAEVETYESCTKYWFEDTKGLKALNEAFPKVSGIMDLDQIQLVTMACGIRDIKNYGANQIWQHIR